MLYAVTLFFSLALATPLPFRTAPDPILTTISKTPELSTFYSLFNGTGGGLGIPGPDFEERFNDRNIGLNFTVFAPTNEALARLPPSLISGLTAPYAYDMLKIVLLNHIAPGTLNDADLAQGNTVEMIGGFSSTFDNAGGIVTNAGIHPNNVPTPPQAKLLRNEAGEYDCIPAINGRVCKINHILDGFLTYFGEDPPMESQQLPPVTTVPGTTWDILSSHTNLSTLSNVLQEVDPGFVARLTMFSKDEQLQRDTIFLAPSNDAFGALPNGSYASLTQPSNAAVSSFFLRAGQGRVNSNETQILSFAQQLNITLTEGRASNALIHDRICAENGCVWIVGRLLDPLFAATLV